MDHHTSWYNFFPLYEDIFNYFQSHYSYTVIFNEGLFPNPQVFSTMHHVFSTIVASVILFIISTIIYYKTKNVQKYIIPSSKISLVNIFELFYEGLKSFMFNIMGDRCKHHLPFVGSLCLFIFLSNILGLIPGSRPATDNLNTTLACGFSVFVYFNYWGFKINKLNHIGHLANPIGVWWGWFLSPFFLPLEIIGLCIRPFSLAIRLAGNLIGDHSVVSIFSGIMPFLLPLPFMFFGLVVCVIQSYVFCLLTCVYISIHTEDSH